ncbi:MAG TPA: transposase [Longimicrobiales bacterium]
MGRLLRPTLPGAPFHITARTQWKEPLFDGLEGAIAAVIRGSIDRSDAQLLAYAVMSNHIHVILVQGRRPLAGYMQPLLRRIALLVIRRTGREGHVFGGRYSHSVCQDPEYFRSMVAYVHLNPVRAGICRRPEHYPWTSHHAYARGARSGGPESFVFAVERGLRIFAQSSEESIVECRRQYRAFVRWRLAMDQYLEDESGAWRPLPRAPLSLGGDLNWHRYYGTASSLRMTGVEQPPERRIDLRDHVRNTLEDIAPDLPLGELCAGGRSRALVRVRNQVIGRARTAGYTTTRLATFLGISPSAVSNVWSAFRRAGSG